LPTVVEKTSHGVPEIKPGNWLLAEQGFEAIEAGHPGGQIQVAFRRNPNKSGNAGADTLDRRAGRELFDINAWV
jgi:hypothetical protein